MTRSTKRPKVLIATGSSGGHLLPAVAFAQAFQEAKSSDISFVLARRSQIETPEALKQFTVYWLGFFPLPRKLDWNAILFPFRLIGNAIQSLWIVARFRPNLVIGFGSFVSVPVVLAAKLMGIPTLLHEQNRTLGKANQLLSKVADRVAVSFPLDISQSKNPQKKQIHTGNLLRRSVVEMALRTSYVSPKKTDKLNILILGGSQGSSFLNKSVVEALQGMELGELSQIRIRHITGPQDYDEVREKYEQLRPELEAFVIPFDRAVENSYVWSHWVIARSGSGVLFELMAFERPSLLIPYPHAESHQVANARFYEKQRACSVMEEADVTSEHLREQIREVLRDASRLDVQSHNTQRCKVLNATEQFCKLAESMMVGGSN